MGERIQEMTETTNVRDTLKLETKLSSIKFNQFDH